jgi:hypothetical protein
MTRVMVGDALVFENERLQQRTNQFLTSWNHQAVVSVPFPPKYSPPHGRRANVNVHVDGV